MLVRLLAPFVLIARLGWTAGCVFRIGYHGGQFWNDEFTVGVD